MTLHSEQRLATTSRANPLLPNLSRPCPSQRFAAPPYAGCLSTPGHPCLSSPSAGCRSAPSHSPPNPALRIHYCRPSPLLAVSRAAVPLPGDALPRPTLRLLRCPSQPFRSCPFRSPSRQARAHLAPPLLPCPSRPLLYPPIHSWPVAARARLSAAAESCLVAPQHAPPSLCRLAMPRRALRVRSSPRRA